MKKEAAGPISLPKCNESEISISSGDSIDTEEQDRKLTGLMRHMNAYLTSMGLSKFSSGVALGYLQNRLEEDGGPDKFKHVISFFLTHLNRTCNKKGDGSFRLTYHCEATNESWQRGCPNLYKTLTAAPVWNSQFLEKYGYTSLISCVREIESSYSAILKEFHGLRSCETAFQPYRSPASVNGSNTNDVDELGQKGTAAGTWNVAYLYLHGLDFEENVSRCPQTVRLLNEVLPRHYSHAFFSVLSSGTHVTPHYGPTNKKLRIHLPLIVPQDAAWLRVADCRLYLEEGKVIMFDDSHEHEAGNDHTKLPRVVLIMDIWHPDLSDEEVKFLTFINKGQILAAKKLREAVKEQGEECDGDFLSIIEKARLHPISLSGYDVRDD